MIFRQAVAEDVPEVAALQRRVQRGLSDPGMLVCDEEAFFAGIVAGSGRIALAEDDGRLVGCSIIYFPGAADAGNLGRALGLAERYLAGVAHLDSAFFLPEYRGRGLAGALGRDNIAAARRRGAEFVMATAAPHNISSLRNLFSLGFHIRALAELYGGKTRFVLSRPAEDVVADATPVVLEVACADLPEHGRALAAGLCGTGLRRDGDGGVIFYAAVPMPR